MPYYQEVPNKVNIFFFFFFNQSFIPYLSVSNSGGGLKTTAATLKVVSYITF